MQDIKCLVMIQVSNLIYKINMRSKILTKKPISRSCQDK